MKQLSCLDRKKSSKRIIDSNCVIGLKKLMHPIILKLAGTVITCKVEVTNQCRPLPNKPIIFAANHSAFLDTPISLRTIRRHCYILAGKQHLGLIEWLFFMLNGTIWVDRGNKEDTALSKEGILRYLSENQSILWFPEGTWNLSANQLVLPLKWGIVDIAMRANAQIIPMALDYDWNENVCRVKFGSPISDASLINKRDAIRYLRDSMATLRWELMCNSPILPRTEFTPDQLKKEMYKVIEDYMPLEWEKESSYIYRPFIDSTEVFSHINSLVPCRENAFLLRKR